MHPLLLLGSNRCSRRFSTSPQTSAPAPTPSEELHLQATPSLASGTPKAARCPQYLGDIWGAGLQCVLRASQILQPRGCGVRKSSSSGWKSLRAGTRGSHSSTVRLPRWSFHQNIDARSSKKANTRAFAWLIPGSLCPRGCSCPLVLRGWGDAGSVRGRLVTPHAPSPAGTW